MNSQFRTWFETITTPEKTNTLIEAMLFLLNSVDAELENIWLYYLSRVGIDDNQITFTNIQQLILDSTISAIEQFSVTINEEVTFADQENLTKLLRAIYELDSSELVSEMHNAINSSDDPKEQLLAALDVVCYGHEFIFAELIDQVEESLISKLDDVYQIPTYQEDSATIGNESELLLGRFVTTLTGDDNILEFYRIKGKTPFTFSQLFNLKQGDLMEIEDPHLLVSRMVLLYLMSVSPISNIGNAIEKAINYITPENRSEIEYHREAKEILGQLK